MSDESRAQIAIIFDQLRVLRSSLAKLQKIEEKKVKALRGQQTVEVGESVELSFMKLQNDLAGIEEVLATIAEATGDVSKL